MVFGHHPSFSYSDGENFTVIISNSNVQTLENGSLVIREVGKEDAGQYMVQAINGVGPGISLVVRLTVNGWYLFVVQVFTVFVLGDH